MYVNFKRITRVFLMTMLSGMLMVLSASAQTGATINVRGIVTDIAGEPIIGANILVQGTSSGTITDYDGNFTLQAPADGVLEISYIGYRPQSIPINNRSTINVTMEEDTELLEEVVVIGYGTVRKDDATGSVVAIDASKINKGLATSPSSLLAGQVAGLSVVSSGGAPGSASNIRIRGGSSMSASNDPLIVIDGVPVDTEGINGMADPLSTINANDIETFTVLKDASATAIYGSRASNGVIIITTKKGHSGKLQVAYNGSVSVSTKTGLVDVMDAPTFRNYVIDSFGEDSQQAAALGNTQTNWQDQIFKTATSTDHNVSLAGSISNFLPYRVSVGYTNEKGILKTSGLERYTGSINMSPSFLDGSLRVQLNAKGVYNTNRFADRGAINSATQFDPTMPVYSETNSPYGNGYHMSLKTDGTPIDIGLANPLAILEQKSDKSKVYRSIGNMQVDYNLPFLEGLRANLNMGYDISESNGDVIITDNSPMSWVWGSYKAGWGENSTYYQYKSNTLLDFYLNYNNNFGVHRIDAMGGYSWQRFYSEEENKFPYSAAMAAQTGNEFYKEGNDYSTESYVISFFGRLNYSLLERYLFTLTLRNDGSSRFSPGNKWGLFPSAAFAWRIINEPFMENAGDVMSDLKLRLGYGVTGQQNLGNGDYPWMGRYSYSKAGANYFFGNTKVPLIRPLAYDENLKWEETATYNAGLDFGFLNNRISGTFDVYYRKTTDLLNTVGIAAGTNFSNELLTNVGELENKGVEFSITGRPIVSKDLNWNVSYNITYNRNRITKLTINDDPSYVGVRFGGIDGGTGNNIAIHSVNYPSGSFYVYEQVYDNDGRPLEGVFVDQNADGQINEEDMIVYKNAAPDLFMGLSSQLSYKNWDLNFSLRSNIGNYVYNNIQSNRESRSITYDPSGWLKNKVNSATFTNFDAVHYQSSYYIQNASFLKMDNISVGYNFNNVSNWLQSARLHLTVQNPFVITKYKGLDPEFTNDGIDNNIYPHPRVFILGFNLNF
ncbi:SusC/RagA family [Proteiniphilum saccharofermentans]|uniref:SusC/RagA family n=1 Tax=Proteiniphilum saccharofermentans TaxID=1642647 RepID=A0A1R3SUT6_9BACT|nr:TonB-dependent receptor [Proteiniphilum saccharofermentans]SCD19331.1 SusC/RagA family [Proteiniphilum saccharofermentans]